MLEILILMPADWWLSWRPDSSKFWINFWAGKCGFDLILGLRSLGVM